MIQTLLSNYFKETRINQILNNTTDKNKITLIDPEASGELVTFYLNNIFYVLTQAEIDFLIFQFLALKEEAIDKHIAMHSKMFAKEYKSEHLWNLCEDIRVEYRTSVLGETKTHDEFEKHAQELFRSVVEKIKQGELFI